MTPCGPPRRMLGMLEHQEACRDPPPPPTATSHRHLPPPPPTATSHRQIPPPPYTGTFHRQVQRQELSQHDPRGLCVRWGARARARAEAQGWRAVLPLVERSRWDAVRTPKRRRLSRWEACEPSLAPRARSFAAA